MRIIVCDEVQAEPILFIFNEVITTSTAIYEYAPRDMAFMQRWFEAKRSGGFPVLGAVTDDGRLMGFACLGPFRPCPAYKYTVESSVYVASEYRGFGVSNAIMQALIDAAIECNFHAMIGVIDSANVVSKHLHEKFGFVHAGTLEQAGFKFGRWLNVDFYQLTLPTPEHPN